MKFCEEYDGADNPCWWYDEESDSIIGEVSEKIEVDFVEKD